MSSYSPDLRIELIDSGAQAGTWGTTTNNTFAYLLEAAIAGYQTVSVIASSQALTHINGASATAGDNQSVYAMLQFTTTTGAAFNVYAPPVSKQYIVWNNSGYSMTIYNSAVIGGTTPPVAPNGIGVTIANGNKITVWSDGLNFYDVQAQNLTGTLAIANGGTGQTTANAAFNALAPAQTNNRVLRSNGTNTSFAQVALTTDVSGALPVANGGTGVTTAAAITSLVGNLLFPVGAIYSSTSSTNPGTSLGFGTWTQFAAGRMMMGAGGSFSPGTTGGSNDAIVVSHTHSGTTNTTSITGGLSSGMPTASGVFSSGSTFSGVGFGPQPNYNISMDASHNHSFTTGSTGASGTNANLPPYIVVYMWQRTA